MSPGPIYTYVQALSLSIFLALAVYVASDGQRRPVSLPFIGILLILAGESLADLLLSVWRPPPAALSLITRGKWILGLFIVPLMLQLSALLMDGRWRRAANAVAGATAMLAAITAIGFGLGDSLLQLGAAPMGANLHPAGFQLVTLWLAVAAALVTGMLGRAALYAKEDSRRQEARHLWVVWLILLGSGAAMLLTAGSKIASAQSLYIMDGLHRLATLVAGGYLCLTVLRFGSPAGRPLDPQMTPVVISTAGSLLVLDALPLLLASDSASPGSASWMIPSLSGLVAGAMLGEPRLARLAERWFMAHPSDRTAFLSELGAAWHELAGGRLRQDRVDHLRVRLQAALCASFIRIVGPHSGAQADEPGPSDSRHPAGGLTLSIAGQQGTWGHLVIGEPYRGGVYGAADRNLVGRFSEFLAASYEAGFGDNGSQTAPGTGEVWIRTFGRLSLAGEGEDSLPLRARQVLALLVTSYPEGLSAEQLVVQLWPESSPTAAHNNLHVAVHALRRALQPQLARGMESKYLIRRGGVYRLSAGAGLTIDRLDFQAAYQAGQRGIRRGDCASAEGSFQRAISLYRGPYLNDSDLQLSVELEAVRHRLREQFIEMVVFVAGEHANRGDHQTAERGLLEALEVEPEADLALRTLVGLYQQQGRQPKARAVEARFAQIQDDR